MKGVLGKYWTKTAFSHVVYLLCKNVIAKKVTMQPLF